jgi:diguanylate cyclase
MNFRKAWNGAIESGEPLSLVMCDIDHFKAFNDTWGHQTGDQVLRPRGELPVRKREGTRHRGALWGRGICRDPAADGTGRRCEPRQSDSAAKVESKKLVKKSTGDILGIITISCGRYAVRSEGKQPRTLFAARTNALYAAKRGGRNRVVSEGRGHVDYRAATAA